MKRRIVHINKLTRIIMDAIKKSIAERAIHCGLSTKCTDVKNKLVKYMLKNVDAIIDYIGCTDDHCVDFATNICPDLVCDFHLIPCDMTLSYFDQIARSIEHEYGVRVQVFIGDAYHGESYERGKVVVRIHC